MEILSKYIYDPKHDLLGRGGFATVYRAHDKILDMPVALKFFHPQEGSNKYNIINEIRRAIVLSHPNIVKYFGVESLVNRDVHGMEEEIQIGVMEYVQEGQMKEFLLRQPLLHSELAELLVGVLEGLKYLHSQGIIHRDIKPQNILLGRDKQDKLIAKIADFGISKNVDSSHTSSSLLLGTVEYMAPEQFNPERYGIGKRVSYNVDIWAFGVTAYALLCGRPLFGARSGETSPGELINKIVNVENLEEQLHGLQEPFRSLIARCVIPDAKSRTSSIDELIGILRGSSAPAIHNLHATVSVNLNGYPSTGGQETAEINKVFEHENSELNLKTRFAKTFNVLFHENKIDENNLENKPEEAIKNIPSEKKLQGKEKDFTENSSRQYKTQKASKPLIIISIISIGLLSFIGVLLQSMSEGPLWAAYVTGIMWLISWTFSAMFIHSRFSKKEIIAFGKCFQIKRVILLKGSIGFTVLSPILSGICFLIATAAYQGVSVGCYFEDFQMGAAMILSIFLLILGAGFIIGMISPQTIGLLKRKEVVLCSLFHLLVPIIILLIIIKLTPLVSGALTGSCY
ncbi:serine/threonine protein kinase [Chitinophagaceae bacterium LB-8]|uniref:Serine/threonine protein kinase n=1 Tax=Paraflavisolibacter caeni TaxID=2982496 RepID=A0A9X3BGS6_9BACT|nr:serine/threonine-protein kinase [Paraflavisolibacter caeni]MCU7551424.1 serine/threonine protein kinase [Paraflavisolibacter caeni]